MGVTEFIFESLTHLKEKLRVIVTGYAVSMMLKLLSQKDGIMMHQ